jgi:hypothetical protein
MPRTVARSLPPVASSFITKEVLISVLLNGEPAVEGNPSP